MGNHLKKTIVKSVVIGQVKDGKLVAWVAQRLVLRTEEALINWFFELIGWRELRDGGWGRGEGLLQFSALWPPG